MFRWKSRLTAALGGAVTLVVLGGVPATAHVTVNPETAAKGDYAKLTFRVPTERDNASTTRLEVTFPEDHPLASVRVKPHPGWSYEVTTAKLGQPVDQGEGEEPLTEAVRTITWTADNETAAIKPREFDEFDISVGPLPENADQLVLKAVQTYDSGEVVRWIEVAAEGAQEPEHPAPILNLTDPAAAGEQSSPTAAQTETGDSGSATTALVLSILALLLGAGGVLTGLLARRRS